MSAKRPRPIDVYIAAQPAAVRPLLKSIRAAIRKVAPKAEESVSYGIPTFKSEGRPLIYFASHKTHIGIYPMTGGVKEKFEKELGGYEQSTGTVRFPLDEPIPLALIAKIVRFRLNEIRQAAARKSKTKTKTTKSKAKKER